MNIYLERIINLAEAGDIDAMVVAIEEFVWNEHYDVQMTPEVRDKVVEYLEKAIKAGNVRAMNHLGAMFAEGRLVEKDPEQAFVFYKMASEAGDTLATCNLGFCYYYGIGTEVDMKNAFLTFSKAATLGYGDAIVRLGDMYMKGDYVQQDKLCAFDLYMKAKRESEMHLDDWAMMQVYSDACKRLGACYYNGNGTNVDVSKAVKYYGEAVYYYAIREQLGDAYSHKSYKETIKTLIGILDDLLGKDPV